jgi:hypothetical protein
MTYYAIANNKGDVLGASPVQNSKIAPLIEIEVDLETFSGIMGDSSAYYVEEVDGVPKVKLRPDAQSLTEALSTQAIAADTLTKAYRAATYTHKGIQYSMLNECAASLQFAAAMCAVIPEATPKVAGVVEGVIVLTTLTNKDIRQILWGIQQAFDAAVQ